MKRAKSADLKIESGIPLPERDPREVSVVHRMRKGQSVLIKRRASTDPRNLAGSLCTLGKRAIKGSRWAMRSVKGGWRVWRLK